MKHALRSGLPMAFLFLATIGCITRKDPTPLDTRTARKDAAFLALAHRIKASSQSFLQSKGAAGKGAAGDPLSLAAQNFQKMPEAELVTILKSEQLQSIHRQWHLDAKAVTAKGAGLGLAGPAAAASADWMALVLAGARGSYPALVRFAREPVTNLSSPDDFYSWRDQRARLQEAELRFLELSVEPRFKQGVFAGKLMGSEDFARRVDLLVTSPVDAWEARAKDQDLQRLVAELKVIGPQGRAVTLEDLRGYVRASLLEGEGGELLTKLQAAYEGRLQRAFDAFGGEVANVKDAAQTVARLKTLQFDDMIGFRQFVLAQYVVESNVTAAVGDVLEGKAQIDPWDVGLQAQNAWQDAKTARNFRQPQAIADLNERQIYNNALRELDNSCAGCLLQRQGSDLLVDGDGLYTVKAEARIAAPAAGTVQITSAGKSGQAWTYGAERVEAPQMSASSKALAVFGGALKASAITALVILATDDELKLAPNATGRQNFLNDLSTHAHQLEALWRL